MRESIRESATVLHSDNGAPMRSITLASKMEELGVLLSFSRPRVSNDNAYAEALFRTMKYHQSYPVRRFRDLLSVTAWVDGFVGWYNNEHRHSSIKYVTPNQRHYGEADDRSVPFDSRPMTRLVRGTLSAGAATTAAGNSPRLCSINHPRPTQPAAA